MTVEERLTAAFRAADQYQPSPDLFARVTRSIEEDTAHRRRVRRVAGTLVIALGFIAVYLLVAIDRVDGVLQMPFWTLELLATGIMVGLVLVLGPVIRRFGTAFESDIFRSSPATGRAFLTLMDIAYYLIFGAYTLMTLQYAPPTNIIGVERLALSLEWGTQRVAGLLMLVGLLHGVTIVVLPVVGLVFSANMRRARRARSGDAAAPANPRNDRVDLWISIVVWTVVGLGLLLLVALIVVPSIAGLAG
ncbi:MAG: hypothetical protein U9N56_02715 [Actinomycetota bacterium]|nr:hypothetical protein [Actinomycetota bacterium]